MRRLVGAAVLALFVAGCGGDGSASPGGTVTVLAAASLTEPFTTLANSFEQAHRGVTIRLSFGGSSGLAQQIVQGAPADVFAAASPTTMAIVTSHRPTGTPRVFVRNRLEIAVPPDNAAGVRSLRDLAAPGMKLALCAPQVPCGAIAAKAFTAAGVRPHPVTLEPDVKAVLTKVTLGEVDAGVVYRTDVRAAGDRVRGVRDPTLDHAVTDYPILALHGGIAAAFVRFVLGPYGQRVLAAAGFERRGS